MSYDTKKFKTLVHYVVWRTRQYEGFGAVRLYKVLWLSDLKAYMLHRKPITGATYVREGFGPVPIQIMSICAELEAEGVITMRRMPYGNMMITRFHADEHPNMTLFSEEERRIIDGRIQDAADPARDESEDDFAWQIATEGEEIPMYAIFARRIGAPEGEEMEWAKTEAKRLGLC